MGGQEGGKDEAIDRAAFQQCGYSRSAVRNEHTLLISILERLNEIEKRSLYLEEGYSSLFAFCTCRWRYSPSKAGRFISAARCMKKLPAARMLLVDRRITVCGLAKIARLLAEGNPEEIL